MRNIILIIAAVLIVGGIFWLNWSDRNEQKASPAASNEILSPSASLNISSSPSSTPTTAVMSAPINRWQERVTKKPFGIKITPANSPVQPERFSGFHTGVDFETFSDEQNADISIYAICSGPLKEKKWASGYGGVAVQACQIDNQDVTVIYGHLNLASIAVQQNQQIASNEKISILGKAFSTETDGERKHLHLGIHKGFAINILGYVQNSADLANWLDITEFLTK